VTVVTSADAHLRRKAAAAGKVTKIADAIWPVRARFTDGR